MLVPNVLQYIALRELKCFPTKLNEICFQFRQSILGHRLSLMCFAPFCYLDFGSYKYFVILREVEQFSVINWNKRCDKYP